MENSEQSPMEITVKDSCSTYTARCQGKSASATGGAYFAAKRLAAKLTEQPAENIELTELPDTRPGYTRWKIQNEEDCHPARSA